MTGTISQSIDAQRRARLADCILRVAQSSCREAFTELFQFYAPRVKSYLMRIGAGENEAEEAAQEVMALVWRKAGQYDPEKASPSTWVFRIARNKSIDAHRRRTKPALDPFDPMLRPPEIEELDAEINREQDRVRVREALAGLPPEQAELLHAAFYEGLSHSEIAEKRKLPLGTVKSRIRLAFQRMRRALDGEA